jgi:mRNA-degrading endonuclease YafQ of YafQ-DinJ toxin-antitoxin module
MNKKFPKDFKLKRGKIFVQRDFYEINEVFDSLSKKLNLEEKKQDFNIMLFWKDFITDNSSELIAKNTFAHRFTKDRKLVIGIKSAVIANELQMIKALLEKEFLKAIEKFDRTVTGLVFELRS